MKKLRVSAFHKFFPMYAAAAVGVASIGLWAWRRTKLPTIPLESCDVLVVGGSMAAGEGATGKTGWTQMLAEKLTESFGLKVSVAAYPDFDSYYVRENLKRLLAACKPAAVVIACSPHEDVRPPAFVIPC